MGPMAGPKSYDDRGWIVKVFFKGGVLLISGDGVWVCKSIS